VAKAALSDEGSLAGLQLLWRGRRSLNRCLARSKQNRDEQAENDHRRERFWYSLQPVRHRRGIYHA
jgi:hypothetical protein